MAGTTAGTVQMSSTAKIVSLFASSIEIDHLVRVLLHFSHLVFCVQSTEIHFFYTAEVKIIIPLY